MLTANGPEDSYVAFWARYGTHKPKWKYRIIKQQELMMNQSRVAVNSLQVQNKSQFCPI